MELPKIYETLTHRFSRGGDGVVRETGIYEGLFPALQRNEMRVEPTDIFLVSYPKSGTIWTMTIVASIMRHGDTNKLNIEPPAFIDSLFGSRVEEKLRRLNAPQSQGRRRFLSHVWPEYMPPRVLQGQNHPKVIYIMRNPKDVAVSFYYFHRSSKNVGQVAKDMTFSQFLPYYMSNDIHRGGWFDHVTKWWKHKDDRNILFVKYEDAVRDRREYISRIAEFLEIGLPKDKLDVVTETTSFDAMKKYVDAEMNVTLKAFGAESTNPADFNLDLNTSHFIRKGKVGDWKNYFTVAESEMFDKLYKEKMAENVGLEFEFE